MNSFSEGRPSQRARAPVATITESALYVAPAAVTENGRDDRSTAVASTWRTSVPKRSAWRRKRSIIS